MTQLDRIRVARGGKRPETPEEWERYEADKKARRAKNVANAREVLARNNIEWYERPTFTQVEFRVEDLDRKNSIRYYPETGAWLTYEGEQHFGVRNLVRHIKGSIK
jgi:hypothetical protein